MSLIDQVIEKCGWKFRAIASAPRSILDVCYPDFMSMIDEIVPFDISGIPIATDKRTENMEIWDYHFSFKNFKKENLKKKSSGGGKVRPVVIFKNDNLGNFVIRIGTPKEDKLDLHYKRFGVEIDNFKDYGLDKKSYIMPNIIRPLEPDRLVRKRGTLDAENFNKMLQGFIDTFLNEFENPWEFMEWCKSVDLRDTKPVERNDNFRNKLQTVDDVKRTRRANCVDIATVVHKLCSKKKLRLKHAIVISYFQDKTVGGSWEKYVYSVFAYEGICYGFRYVSNLRKGDIEDSSYKTINDTIMLSELPVLLDYFRNFYNTKKVRTRTIIIDNDNWFDTWDFFVSRKMRQIDLLDYLRNVYQSKNHIIVRESNFDLQ